MTVTPLRSSKIYDLDGTLIECGIYYDQCLAKGAATLAERTGIPEKAALEVIQKLDLVAVQTPGHSWGRERFPNSFRAAAYAACAIVGIEQRQRRNAVAEELWHIGDAVFYAPYALYDKVLETLTRDRTNGWQLILYTKGDADVQQMKVDKHNLSAYVDHVCIVPDKKVERLQQIVGDCGVDIATSWMIGDSKKDDIAPAQQLGLNTALVVRGEHTWSYNDLDIDPPTLVVGSVAEVPSQINAFAFGVSTARKLA